MTAHEIADAIAAAGERCADIHPAFLPWASQALTPVEREAIGVAMVRIAKFYAGAFDA